MSHLWTCVVNIKNHQAWLLRTNWEARCKTRQTQQGGCCVRPIRVILLHVFSLHTSLKPAFFPVSSSLSHTHICADKSSRKHRLSVAQQALSPTTHHGDSTPTPHTSTKASAPASGNRFYDCMYWPCNRPEGCLWGGRGCLSACLSFISLAAPHINLRRPKWPRQ